MIDLETNRVYLLSKKFISQYPQSKYPELMQKDRRPYICLIIETISGVWICVPFRSKISHKNAYLFKNSVRSINKRSGLDYSKLSIIQDIEYIDQDNQAIVDNDEYDETVKNLQRIRSEVEDYIETYKRHITGEKILHPKQYDRLYGYSTLQYFHNELGI